MLVWAVRRGVGHLRGVKDLPSAELQRFYESAYKRRAGVIDRRRERRHMEYRTNDGPRSEVDYLRKALLLRYFTEFKAIRIIASGH